MMAPVYAHTLPPLTRIAMSPWHASQFVVFDIETTGPSPDVHDLLAVAVSTVNLVKSSSPYSPVHNVMPRVGDCMWCSVRPPGKGDTPKPATEEDLQELIDSYAWHADTREFWEGTEHMRDMQRSLVHESTDLLEGITKIAEFFASTITVGPDGKEVYPTVVAKPSQFDCGWLSSRISRILESTEYKEKLTEKQRSDLIRANLVLTSHHSICLQTRTSTSLYDMGQDTRSIMAACDDTGAADPSFQLRADHLTEFQKFAFTVRQQLNPMLGCPLITTHHPMEDVAGQIADFVALSVLQDGHRHVWWSHQAQEQYPLEPPAQAPPAPTPPTPTPTPQPQPPLPPGPPPAQP